MSAIPSPYVLLLVVAGILNLVVGSYSYNHRERTEAAKPLALTLFAFAAWNFIYAAKITISEPSLHMLVGAFNWAVPMLSGVYILTFAITYTLPSVSLARWHVWVLSVVPLLTLLVAMTNDLHSLLWIDYNLVYEGGIYTSNPTYGLWQSIALVFAYGLFVTSFVILAAELLSHNSLYFDQATAIGVGVLFPLVVNFQMWVTWDFFLPGSMDPTPYALTVTGLMFGYSVFRDDLLKTIPAARKRGEQAVLQNLDAGIVLLDGNDVVQTVNPVVESLFDVDARAASGNHFSDVFDVTLPAAGETTAATIETDDGYRMFEIVSLSTQDDPATPSERGLLFTDISDRRRREQRLAVLGRALRHNLRNDATVVRGFAADLAEKTEGELADQAEMIVHKTEEIVNLGEKAREIDQILQTTDETPEAITLDDFVTAVVDDFDPVSDDVQISVSVPEITLVTSYRDVLAEILHELLSNADVHVSNAPVRIEVSASEREDGRVELVVADNGTGIPEHEREVFAARRETALKHGTGLGLWLVHWGCTRLGGTVSIDESAWGGAAVRIELPMGEVPEDRPRDSETDAPAERDEPRPERP